MNWTRTNERLWSPEQHDYTRVDEAQYNLRAEVKSRKRPPIRYFEIKAHYHYNGSGPKAFGGAKEWPVVTVEVPFPEGAIEQRDQFVDALQVFLDATFNPRRKDQPHLKHDTEKMG